MILPVHRVPFYLHPA